MINKEASVGFVVLTIMIVMFFGVALVAKADYTISTGGSSYTDSAQVGTFANTNAGCCNLRLGQQFSVATNGEGAITSIEAQLYVFNSPTGQVYVTIETSDGGSPASPTGTILGTSDNISHSTGAYTGTATSTITFSTPVEIEAGQTYFVVFRGTVDNGSSNAFGSAMLAATSPQARSYYSGAWNTSAGYQARMAITVSSSTPEATVSSTTIVDNPAQNVANALLLFLGFMWFTAWFFSKKR